MHSSQRNFWLPLVAAVAGFMVSPLMGQDTSEGLAEWGFSEDEIATLLATGAVVQNKPYQG